jgi:hypothetical protein
MFIKIITVVFFASVGLYFVGFHYAYDHIVVGVTALVLAIATAIG